MHLNNKTYILIDKVDITQTILSLSSQTASSIKYSQCCTKAILKFSSPYLDELKGIQKYTHEQILQYIEDNEMMWNPETI